MRQHVALDTDTVVRYGHEERIIFCARRHRDGALVARELRCVFQQIGHCLSQPVEVAVDVVTRRQKRHCQRLIPASDLRRTHVDGAVDRSVQIHWRQIDTESAVRNARHIEEIVYQARLDLHVALNRLERVTGTLRQIAPAQQRP